MDNFRRVFELYGYGEVVTPAFEHLELLEAKAGEEVKEQIYWFEDKAGRKLGLRFELTTSIARIIANNPMIPKPIRYYYIQPVWRYEEPQKGRLREFWQAGIELMGLSKPEADAEIIAVTRRALRSIGLTNLIFRVNDRKVMEKLFEYFGFPRRLWESIFRLVDKIDKMDEDSIIQEITKLGIDKDSVISFLGLIKEKRSISDTLGLLRDLLGDSVSYMESLFNILEEWYNIKYPEISYDLSIVRGLAYYTGFVFETYVESMEDIGAVAGGGRYDNLIQIVGGPRLPATGMAIGVERVYEIASRLGLLSIDYSIADVLVVAISQELSSMASRISESLREHGIRTILDISGRRLRGVLEYADKNRVRFVIILGTKDYKNGECTVKDMMRWADNKVKIDKVVHFILNNK